MKRIFHHVFGTVLGIGHIPIVPASWTSLAIALAFYFAQPSLTVQGIALAVFLVTGVIACGGLEREYGEDPKQATADEAAGMSITLFAAPLDFATVMVGFVLFRIFDVVKPPPARQLESLHGGLGIMADDVAAGIYARGVLSVYLYFAHGHFA